MYDHITSRMHLSKQLISERASLRRGQAQPMELSHLRPDLRRNEPHIILVTTPPLMSRNESPERSTGRNLFHTRGLD